MSVDMEKKLGDLLREKFDDFGESDYYGFYAESPKTIDYTEYLLGLHDYDIETEIWNYMSYKYTIEREFPEIKKIVDVTDRYPLVKAFIREREEKYYHYAPFNQPIKTERLLLKTMPDEDAKYLFESIKKDHAVIPSFWNCLPEDEEKIKIFEHAFLYRERIVNDP
ncbi:MAG: hypothetical protein J5874_00055, partial [Oscillospiraceae bacterium]|nr:hypothetical protein [Oscillospiraceae bacterium]